MTDIKQLSDKELVSTLEKYSLFEKLDSNIAENTMLSNRVDRFLNEEKEKTTDNKKSALSDIKFHDDINEFINNQKAESNFLHSPRPKPFRVPPPPPRPPRHPPPPPPPRPIRVIPPPHPKPIRVPRRPRREAMKLITIIIISLQNHCASPHPSG